MMQCSSCSCTCCEHFQPDSRRKFVPYHRAPSPPLPANTLILPSSASAFDAPPHQSTRKRAFLHATNISSAQLLEALYWEGEGEQSEAEPSTAPEQDSRAEGEWAIVHTGEPKVRQESTSPPLTQPLPTAGSHAARSLRPPSPRPPPPRSATPRPPSPRPLSQSQQPASSSQVLTINRAAVPSSASSPAQHLQPPASARSAASSRSHSPALLDSDTAVFRGRRPLTSSSEPGEEASDAKRDAVAASLETRKREAELHWERDKARREVLRSAFESAQQSRLQRVAADDRFYNEMLRRQWERRVMMQHFEARAQQERQRRRSEQDGTSPAAAAETADFKPVFADYGASSAQRLQDGQRLRTFNISPDVGSALQLQLHRLLRCEAPIAADVPRCCFAVSAVPESSSRAAVVPHCASGRHPRFGAEAGQRRSSSAA